MKHSQTMVSTLFSLAIACTPSTRCMEMALKISIIQGQANYKTHVDLSKDITIHDPEHAERTIAKTHPMYHDDYQKTIQLLLTAQQHVELSESEVETDTESRDSDA